MTYKTILVHLDGTSRCAERVALASSLALDFDAHLVGVYVTPWPFPPGGLVVHPTREMIEHPRSEPGVGRDKLADSRIEPAA